MSSVFSARTCTSLVTFLICSDRSLQQQQEVFNRVHDEMGTHERKEQMRF